MAIATVWRATMLAGVLAVAVLLAVALWIPTVTHRTSASGCYTEFGLVHGGGLATCSHTETEVRSYPRGRRDALAGAIAVALLTGAVPLARGMRRRPQPMPSARGDS